MAGKDGLALLPTGGGKSICFQVPGMAMDGLVLVVSPLIALMKDQVQQLKKRDIRAAAFHSNLSWGEIKLMMENALQGHYKFLYVSPERLASESFREYLPNLNLAMLVIDEAHCISQWGYDFRPPYKRIAEIQELLPQRLQTVAFTASATDKVRKDILDKLELNKPFQFIGDFARPNLHYGCLEVANKNVKLLELCNMVKGCGIVFVNSRKDAEHVAKFLQSHQISANFYHAGLSADERNKRQNEWMNNQSRIMVCTNAFGMGVDKPDVRLVAHLQPSLSPEAYYQEAGRAGRDGKEAWCVLLYEDFDFKSLMERNAEIELDEQELGRIYNAILTYLGVPPGSGEEQVYQIDITEMATYFKVNPKRLYNGIKALQILDVWSFEEESWSPPKVTMKANAALVYDAKVKYKEHERMLDFLLRNYTGIYGSYVTINPTKISKYFHKLPQEIENQLTALTRLGLIDYQPKSEKSSLFLQENRSVYSTFVMTNLDHVQLDRKSKLKAMEDYCLRATCRSAFWEMYFLKKVAKPCGACDICRAKKKPSENESTKIQKVIKKLILSKPLGTDELLKTVPKKDLESFQKELRWLLDHKFVKIEKKGDLTWVKK
jgi:ATP-dependent DNA helicase RecQ